MGKLKEIFYDIPDEKVQMRMYKQCIPCIKQKKSFTIFDLSEKKEVDEAIIEALLKGQSMEPFEQLQLTLIWNRADLARDKLLCDMNITWGEKDFDDAMTLSLA